MKCCSCVSYTAVVMLLTVCPLLLQLHDPLHQSAYTPCHVALPEANCLRLVLLICMQVTLVHLSLTAAQPPASPFVAVNGSHQQDKLPRHDETMLAASTLATSRSVRTWLVEQIPPNFNRFKRCYSSATDDTSSAAGFHQQCDHYDRTLVLVRNLVNGTRRLFGGFAGTSWDPLTTCGKPGNDRRERADTPQLFCIDISSELTSFIFSLSPGDPVRFNHCYPCAVPGVGNTHDTLSIGGDALHAWPSFMHDLDLGKGQLGEFGRCDQGPSYSCDGSEGELQQSGPVPACEHQSCVQSSCYNKICGGDRGTWQETELEVWGLAV
jgi:hypothetical protein